MVSPPPQEKPKRNGTRPDEARPTVESLLDELEGSVPSPRYRRGRFCPEREQIDRGKVQIFTFCAAGLYRVMFYIFQPSGSSRRFGLAVPAAGQNLGFLRHTRARRADGVFVRLQGTKQREGNPPCLTSSCSCPLPLILLLLLCPLAQFFGLSAGSSRTSFQLSSSSGLFLLLLRGFSFLYSVPPVLLSCLLFARRSRAAYRRGRRRRRRVGIPSGPPPRSSQSDIVPLCSQRSRPGLSHRRLCHHAVSPNQDSAGPRSVRFLELQPDEK